MLAQLAFASQLLAPSDVAPTPDPSAIYATRCALCHRLGDRGTPFGPELSDVGLRLTREQIIESIEDPSKEIAEGHEYVELSLRDGRKEYGVLAPQSAGMILLRQPGGITKRISKDDVEKSQKLPVSGMTLFTEKLLPAERDVLVDWLLGWKVPVARTAPPKIETRSKDVPTWFLWLGGVVAAILAGFALRSIRRNDRVPT